MASETRVGGQVRWGGADGTEPSGVEVPCAGGCGAVIQLSKGTLRVARQLADIRELMGEGRPARNEIMRCTPCQEQHMLERQERQRRNDARVAEVLRRIEAGTAIDPDRQWLIREGHRDRVAAADRARIRAARAPGRGREL